MSTVAAIGSGTTAVGTPTASELAQLNSTSGAEGGETTLGENDFLKLLTVQLQNQDPLQPMQDTEFISQMATFSSLSEMTSLNSNFSSFSSQQGISGAQDYLGKTVTVNGAAESGVGATGTVTGVTIENGAPQLTINGVNYAVSDVTAIAPAAAAATTGATGSSSSTNTTSSTTTTPTSSTAGS